ncbi:MAG: GNAT family N-acetyltransferase, partial [Clostridia bacterium]|nr:GNAT family N-acetyltransferase [Clostridia bacterium]
EVHAALRPDLFIPGTTKYSDEELQSIFADDSRPVWVAVDEDDRVLGYAFCMVEEPSDSANLYPHRTLYIDDICVDESARGQHVATRLFEHVKNEARALGCYDITLNVWTGNEGAEKFYEAMGMQPKKTMLEYIL